ncbi:hypothetical protein E2C01_025760 [Portunus trituberculatus]|uniref:Uncharacterized protein n=1 Tax=Portunus trituberculatus TaxID=210409 RepID=A0A5B7EGT0_PORTR|nr:hypothetical protein [Portunus trituberculatus]
METLQRQQLSSLKGLQHQSYKVTYYHRGTMEPCMLGVRGVSKRTGWNPVHGRSELGFLTRGNGFLAGGLSDRRYPTKYPL